MHETTPASTAGRAAGVPASHAVPVWTTVLTVVLIPVAFFFGALAPMATDAHPETVTVVMACWWASWTATPLLVVTSRLSFGRPALARARRWAGWAALVPPTTAILLVLTL
ncbi:hypothetical protein ABZX75_29010 [Streptomyces sp. NPDC003038]|uniref:hypothetical protein n=1 Tax=unclassified Streptomyces TaxID=2593676 RepID=UPI00339EF36F